MAEQKTHKIKITIYAEVTSDEYDSIDSIIEELSSESEYQIPSTDCVNVVDTEWVDCEER